MRSCTVINLFIIVILLVVQESKAQKALYLKPHVGIQSSINHVMQNKLADSEFDIYALHVNPDFGLQLYYDLNENLSYYGGISYNMIRIIIGTVGSSNRSTGRDIIRFPFGIQKKLKTVGLLD